MIISPIKTQQNYDYESLSKESKDYVDRYIRTTSLTREDALSLSVVRSVIDEYESSKGKPKVSIYDDAYDYDEEDRSF